MHEEQSKENKGTMAALHMLRNKRTDINSEAGQWLLPNQQAGNRCHVKTAIQRRFQEGGSSRQ